MSAPIPTRHGMLVLGVSSVLVLIGLWKAINLLALLGFLLLAAVVLNSVLAARQTAGLVLHRRKPHQVIAGQATALEARLEANGTRLDLLIVDEGPTERLVSLVPVTTPREPGVVRPMWQPARRGRQQLGPVFAISGYPFGLVEHRCALLPATEVIVWPALGEIQRGKLTRQFQRRQPRQAARQRPRPERTAQQEFCGLRPFRPGDSPRLIHWRTSARRGELMVREYEDIPPDSLAVVVDASSPGPPEQLEQAISFAATLCWEWCRRRGDRLVLATTGTVTDLRAGTSGPELGAEMLDLLAVVEPGEPARSEKLIDLLARHVGRGGSVVLVSAGPSDLANILRRELGLSVLALPATALADLDGYTRPNVGGLS